ncbi:MAG: putative two-component system sensor kinase [Actinomycetia bacterium]|nr:putative two-component system sensor kinase [Actinomycetes bacterium]
MRRDSGDRLAGGVASGLARWRGFNPTNVRIILVIAALFSQGWLVPFYFIAWLLIPVGDAVPAEPENRAVPGGAPPGDNDGNAISSANAVIPVSTANIWSRARHDSRGITLAAGVVSVICVFLLEAGVLNDQVIQDYGWPQVVSAACLVLIWRNASDAEQASLRRLVAPLGGLGPDADRRGRGTVFRLALACVMVAVGMGWLLSTHNSLAALLRPLSGFVLILGGLVLLLGPWWLRIARDLVLERQARARAEERADMAARVHDSVLQTLALIQRRADDPAQVTQLARAQERELRSWLFEGRAPGSMHEVTSLAAGVRQIQQEAEARHGVPVEVVTVGDCPLDDDLGALLEAAREAVVNAAKWSQASVISLYAEVTAEDVELVVRDRGRGFDPAAVPGDRKGMAESIHGRMGRHGGTVTVQTAVGEGTKVSLKMPRSAVRASS